MIEITDEMMNLYLENYQDIEQAIVNKINHIYKIGEELGFAPKFIDYEKINEVRIDDKHEVIILNYDVYYGEWISESYEFPYKLFKSENPMIKMQRMEQLIVKERKLKKQIEMQQKEEDESRKAKLNYKNDIDKLKELSIKYPDEFNSLKN